MTGAASFDCAECVGLRLSVDRAEVARAEARGKFEAHTSVADGQEAARDYREAADELNRALASLAIHRKGHDT
jgi:hypothetical protein